MSKPKRLAALLLSIFSFHCLSVSSAMGGEPDPVVLLRGVEESRRAIRTGKLELSWSVKQLIPYFVPGDPAHLHVQFDGDRRTYSQFARVVVLNTKKPDDGPALFAKQKEMNDNEAFVRAGFGRWEDTNVRSAWDGNNLCQYGENYRSGYVSARGGTIEFVADPRLLGIGDVTISSTFETQLPYQTAKEIKLDGAEDLLGISTYHVSLKPHPEVEFHYWVEESKGFRLHRFEYRASYRVAVTESTFSGDGPIPSRVTTKTYLHDKRLSREQLLEVRHAEPNVSVDPNVGKIESLGIPAGTEINDERILKRIGYWDGEKVVDDYNTAMENARTRLVAAERRRSARWGVVVAAAVIAVAIVGFSVRRKFRHAKVEGNS
jgi:hypothetical protein